MKSPRVRGRFVALRVLAGAALILSGLLPAAAALPSPVAAVSTTVVVSQVYGGGGNA